MQGRMYTTKFKAVAVTAVQDLFEILAGTGKPLIIHGFLLSQHTEIADAQEEQLLLTANRGAGSVTSGAGGSTHTPAALGVDDIASGATVEINNTTIMAAGSGTLTELEPHAWNVRVPYPFWYPPEARPYIKPGDRWTLELESTPADSITMNGCVWFEEVG